MVGTNSETSYRYSPYLFAFLAILGWSTSATFGGLLSGNATSLQIVFSIQLVALVTLVTFNFSWFSGENVSGIIRILMGNSRLLYAAIIFSLFLCAYQIFFYFALLSVSRLYANIANYLWPIFLYLVLLTPVMRRRERFRLLDLLLLVLAFFGVLSLTFGADLLSATTTQTAAFLGVAAGFIAACCAAVYMSASSLLLVELERHNFKITSPQLYACAMIPTMVVLGAFLFWTSNLPNLTFGNVSIFLWLGVVTVAIAQTSWTHAISTGTAASIPVLAYLVPVLSTGLQVVVFDDAITPSLIFGIVFIIAASVLTARVFGQILAETAAVVAFMYVGFASFFGVAAFADLSFQAIDVFSLQIFGLLIAFALNRQSQSIQNQRERLFSWRAKIAALIRLSEQFKFKSEVDRQTFLSNLSSRVAECTKAVVLIDQASDAKLQSARYSEYSNAETRLFRLVIDNSPKSSLLDAQRACDEILDASSSVLVAGVERIGRGELSIIGILGLAASIFYSATSSDTSTRALLSMLVVSAITFLVFRVFKQNVQPALTTMTELEKFQYHKELTNSPVFAGDISKLSLDSEVFKLERTLELQGDNGDLTTCHSADRQSPVAQLLVQRRVGLAFLSTGAIIVATLVLSAS